MYNFTKYAILLGKIFREYIEILNSINEKELNEIIESLVNIFKNLNKIAEAF